MLDSLAQDLAGSEELSAEESNIAQVLDEAFQFADSCVDTLKTVVEGTT